MEEPRTAVPDSAVDFNVQSSDDANKAMPPETPVQIPIIDVSSEPGRLNSTKTDKTEAQAGDAISSKESKISSANDGPPDGASSAPLWCPVTLRSHASLVEWGVSFCESCKQNLTPPEKKLAEDNKDEKKEDNDEGKEEVDKKDQDIAYKIKFLDEEGFIISVNTWHEQLDLDRERQSITKLGSAKPIIEVISVVRTDIAENDHSWNDRDGLFQDIIKDPNVTVDHGGREIVVNSRPILTALRRIITYYPGLQLIGQSFTLEPPYCVYYHHMQDIRAYQLTWTGADGYETRQKHPMEKRKGFTPCNEETYNHLNMLRDVMEEHQELETVTDEIDRYRRSPPVATYRMLWLLLKPGTTVYANLGGSLAACVISSVTFKVVVGKPPEKYRVNMWYLDFDGVKLGRCKCSIDVKPFDGEREITHLDVIPSKYYDNEDGGALRRRLVARGEKYFGLLSGAQVDYEGETLGDQRRWIQGRVIIDPSTYYTYAPASEHDYEYRADLRPPVVGKINDDIVTTRAGRSRRERDWRFDSSSSSDSEGYHPRRRYGNRYKKRNHVGPWAAYDNIIPKGSKLQDLENVDSEETRRHLCLLCPKEVVGFDLTSRQWELLDAELCADANFNKTAIENLVMPEDRIFLIKSLVHRFTSSDAINGKVPKAWTADFIQHKGEGQIFLLHGSPGVGKTYTAECISEATGRPLLSLTAGDIGTSELLAERTLSKWFRMAEVWGAVMLIDEADVFLEKRVHQDLQRNGLVSIFLRTIEYYRGILFLTTNRVGQFDDAFVSRIHVVIRYTSLTPADRNRIWNQFFQKLENERGEDIKITESARDFVLESKRMTSIQWNGREIRNAFQTAVALADYRFFTSQTKSGRATLERQDFEKVCATTDAFKKYLSSIPMADEAKRALKERDRNDNFLE
ncbi:hypothetical protein VPNG_07168 [Cytospora leucostoma]|uniref:AAA+ ATPase domain-containing protein n=1 Tax=Cytospora leucostoma TaxID=1230097 RepID=A0A423WJV6_9PEZI|nr:hypothetical protein VPNG_07168 [Cytospora leucostoma]